ncbi:hypothetical protein EW145_g2161 [Phellinidium pouzarii]|uniref:SMODS and SLOG-associating 2TM effector domain-containing protein n=1 Tax=Phellinidium pouzarii TaxID=167371 RepID=A0A4S4LBY5_9AGAM|nr:hypothetical protein EW145_g2161 [Phellinidium pouzarii]
MSASLEKFDEGSTPVSPSGRELDLGLASGAIPIPNLVRDSGVTMGAGMPGGMSLRERGGEEGEGKDREHIIDWVVPEFQGEPQELDEPDSDDKEPTVFARLKKTIENAKTEEIKYTKKATMTGFLLNAAIGLQVFISALITALSAVTSGRHTQVMTSVLGGAGTIVASYLARTRGSNEPELSIARVKDLQKFIRECDAFVGDHGWQRGRRFDDRIEQLRTSLEHLLGNGDGERRLAPIN